MSNINDPIKGRRYRRQITLLILVSFIFCRSILPTKGLNVRHSNTTSTPVEKKKSQNTQIDWAEIIFAGVAIAMIYEIFQDDRPSSPQGSYSSAQADQDLEDKMNQDMYKNQEQNERYEQDKQTRENEQENQQ